MFADDGQKNGVGNTHAGEITSVFYSGHTDDPVAALIQNLHSPHNSCKG